MQELRNVIHVDFSIRPGRSARYDRRSRSCGTPDEYACTLGKWKRWGGGVSLERLTRGHLREFLDWVYDEAVTTGRVQNLLIDITMRIPRHSISNLDAVSIAHAEDMAKLPEVVNGSRASGKSRRLGNIALMAAQTGSAIDGKSAEVGQAIRLAADAAACGFAAVSTANVQPLLGGQPPARLERSNESEMHTGRWTEAFFLNMLCRNTNNIDLLCGVPLKVLSGSSTQGPEYCTLFVRALQSYWANSPRTVELLIEAMQKTDPERHQFVEPEYVLQIDVPQIYLFSQIASEDPAAAGTLVTALENHKKYWSRTRDRRLEPIGFLAINLLGLAALAYEKGMRFDIDSEYLPMYLVDGSFLKM